MQIEKHSYLETHVSHACIEIIPLIIKRALLNKHPLHNRETLIYTTLDNQIPCAVGAFFVELCILFAVRVVSWQEWTCRQLFRQLVYSTNFKQSTRKAISTFYPRWKKTGNRFVKI